MIDDLLAKDQVEKWTDQRANALTKLHDEHGWSLRQIADVVHLSQPQVQRLVDRGRQAAITTD